MILIYGCTSATEPDNSGAVVVEPQPGLPFELKMGWRAFLPEQGIAVEFVELVEDSRCPGGGRIRCIWEGDGAVAVAIFRDHAITRVDTLHTTFDPKAVSVGDLRLEFTQLSPYAEANKSIPLDRYVATFVL